MQMTEGEIISSYRQAKEKGKQVTILAELNACTKGQIEDILTEAGYLKNGKHNDAATKECTCEEGREWRQKQKAQTLSDENIESLTEADEWLKDIIAAGRNQMISHPEMKGLSITVVDPVSVEKRAYKLKTDKDGNVIATRTNSTAAAEIIN